MTENKRSESIGAMWSALKTLYTDRIRPLFKGFRFSCSCCRKTLGYFLNTSHFPTLVIAISVVATIFANATPPAASDKGSWANFWGGRNTAAVADRDRPAGSQEITGCLNPGDSLSTAFQRSQIPDDVGRQVIQALRTTLDFRTLRPNDRYALRLDGQGELQECTYESGPLNIHRVSRHADGGYSAERLDVPLEKRTVKISGEVRGSLYEAFLAFNEEPRLIYAFADIFASRIDFNTEIRIGDRFELVFEKYYKNGEFAGYGKILLARYDRKDQGAVEGYLHTSAATPNGSFFDRNGEELGTSFIRSPVPMARVSSTFTLNRLHPVLGILRPHLGVDLAAPTGTPIMAASDGKVVDLGWNGGYGKQIVIDHGGGYRTHYGHLSNYRAGLREGSRVRQKEIIGYVGSTGMSTGPHLDYRMECNRQFVNPFAMKFRPRSVLAGQDLANFRQQQNSLARLSAALDDPKVVLVNSVTITPESNFTFL